jgi:hypothetical protein
MVLFGFSSAELYLKDLSFSLKPSILHLNFDRTMFLGFCRWLPSTKSIFVRMVLDFLEGMNLSVDLPWLPHVRMSSREKSLRGVIIIFLYFIPGEFCTGWVPSKEYTSGKLSLKESSVEQLIFTVGMLVESWIG